MKFSLQTDYSPKYPAMLWRVLLENLRNRVRAVREAASAASQAQLTRRGSKQVVRARLVGAPDASPTVGRITSEDDLPIDSLRSDLKRKIALKSVMPHPESEEEGDTRRHTMRAGEGLFGDLFDAVSDCPDSDRDADGNCPDDPDFDPDTAGQYAVESDPRKALKDLGMEPSEAARSFVNSQREAKGEEPMYAKEDVNYKYSPDQAKSCGKCVFFVEPGACRKVFGLIRTVDVCDLFQPSRAKAASDTFQSEYRKP